MSSNESRSRPRSRLWVFLLWLCCFYSGWALLVFGGGWWEKVKEHWPISVAMTAGSYVAGSTPMGGGTVGFPILVLLFDEEAKIGRNFSFAVQSVGMTSATIFILCTGVPIAWRSLRWTMLGSLIGTPLGAAFIAPYAPDLFITVMFGVIWASFGIMTLLKIGEFTRYSGMTPSSAAFERNIGLFTGLFGGACIAALTGVGIDMLLYTLLVLLLRCDLKIAVPTSVIIMSFTSLVGIGSNVLLQRMNPALYHISPEVFYNWMAAAPIVALGAPLGAFMVKIIPRKITLIFVAILCVIQYVWGCYDKHVTGWKLGLSIVGIFVVQGTFHLLHAWGERKAAAAGSGVD